MSWSYQQTVDGETDVWTPDDLRATVMSQNREARYVADAAWDAALDFIDNGVLGDAADTYTVALTGHGQSFVQISITKL